MSYCSTSTIRNINVSVSIAVWPMTDNQEICKNQQQSWQKVKVLKSFESQHSSIMRLNQVSLTFKKPFTREGNATLPC